MTVEGGKALIRDLNEYCNVSAFWSIILCFPPSFYLPPFLSCFLLFFLPIYLLTLPAPSYPLYFSALLYSSTSSYSSLSLYSDDGSVRVTRDSGHDDMLERNTGSHSSPPWECRQGTHACTHARTHMHTVVDKCMCIWLWFLPSYQPSLNHNLFYPFFFLIITLFTFL